MNDVYIYGAGKYGIDCFESLQAFSVLVKGFVVSDKKGNPSVLFNLPVFELSEIDKKSFIIVALKPSFSLEAKENLKKNGFSDQNCIYYSRRYPQNIYYFMQNEAVRNKIFRLSKECRSFEKAYIYGAGKYGIQCELLLKELGVVVNGFVVTSKSTAAKELPAPLYQFDELEIDNEKTLVIVALNKKWRNEVVPLLKSRKIKNLDFFDPSDVGGVMAPDSECKSDLMNYEKWIAKNETCLLDAADLEYRPLISIIVPVYNVSENELVECIESVINQTYCNWELCMVDDASTYDCVKKTLARYSDNPKIHIAYHEKNEHISKTENDAIAMAKGDFVGFLDCDDVLAPNAIYEVTKKLNENKKLDFIYSDEDNISCDGEIRSNPFFKPEWSPDTLMSLMYTCHFSVYRKRIVDKVGGLKIGMEGAQDYDFTLRFTEVTQNIGHISKILYHWRTRKESTSANIQAKPYALLAQKAAKEEALKRRKLNGDVLFCPDVCQYRIRYVDSSLPLVSIIIPTKDNFDVFDRCVYSILKFTTYKNFEIVVVDNGSDLENQKQYTSLAKRLHFKYIFKPMEFNFSRMCNLGAGASKGDVFLFLNNDIEIIQPDWLDVMVGHASLAHVGAVGAKLYYPNSNIIQHAGVINIFPGPSHAFSKFTDSVIYGFGRNRLACNFSAVTGACVAIKRSKFYEIDGFDEELPVAYNDVALCFSLLEHGYYNVVRNDVVLFHHESLTRGYDALDEGKFKRLAKERGVLYKKHPGFYHNDPFYNPNLGQNRVDFKFNVEGGGE